MVSNEVLADRMAKIMKKNYIVNSNHVNKIAHQMRENEKKIKVDMSDKGE